jgi:hypothetical protein
MYPGEPGRIVHGDRTDALIETKIKRDGAFVSKILLLS